MSRKIDLENHYASESWVRALQVNDGYPRIADDPDTRYRLHPVPGVNIPYRLLDRLLDLGEGRIGLLDEAGIDLGGALSGGPGHRSAAPGRGHQGSQGDQRHLGRSHRPFPRASAGIRHSAPKDVDSAVRELERCVKELGFKGWNTHSNFGDSFLDEKRYWPLLAKAEELNIPIYLHPTYPIVPQLATYGLGVAGPSFGFGMETSMVVMRMIAAGVFDAFPKLKIILGHYGEGFPFMLDRVDRPYIQGHVPLEPTVAPKLKRMPSDYLRDNIISSTSGNYSPQAFACTRDALGTERMVLGTDYPFENMPACMDFLARQPMEEAEKDRLYWETAASLGIV